MSESGEADPVQSEAVTELIIDRRVSLSTFAKA